MPFDIWLEFEHWIPNEHDNPEDDCFNMQITLDNENCYALTVWTQKYFQRVLLECKETGEFLSGAYLLPPDLFVERMDRTLIERIVADLIEQNALPCHTRVLSAD
jgi:hypothetical protein